MVRASFGITWKTECRWTSSRSHVYGNDSAADVFGTDESIPRDEMVCRAAKKVFDQVKASSRPGLPIIFSEYNASYMNELDVTDSIFMGPVKADELFGNDFAR